MFRSITDNTRVRSLAAASCVFGALACHDDNAQAKRVQTEMKALIAAELDNWQKASTELHAAAPTPRGRGWDASLDASAIAEMKDAWSRSREAYERIEGAIAGTFPESDAATDARYEDYLAVLGGPGDPFPFDAEGVIGMHGIERVLWADAVAPEVLTFEKGLPGYRPPAFPSTEEEAARFKNELSKRLLDDIRQLQEQFEPLSLDIAFAFRGLIDLAVEQVEKVDRAASGQEESRYAQSTMRDLRANHQGCAAAYAVFRPWVVEQPTGAKIDEQVQAAFARLADAYAEVDGDAIPSPPAKWSSLSPKPEHLETPFGKLYAVVLREADPKAEGSLHASLIAVAELLELPAPVTK